MLYMNSANRVVHKAPLFKGGIDETIVDIRLLFKIALEWCAVQIILVHNHPSGNTTPSQQDFDLTEKVGKAGKTLDVKLTDHVIITEKDYYSFMDSGVIVY